MQLSPKKILIIGAVATVCTVATGIVASQIKPYRFEKKTENQQIQNITVNTNINQNESSIISPQQEKEEVEPTTQQQILSTPTSSAYNESRKTHLKIFDITTNENGLNPYQLVVHQNDQLQINIKVGEKAIDIVSKGLDVSINTLQPGQSHVLIIDAYKQGDFTFECNTACPGTQKTIGKISVIPPQQ